MGLNWMEMWRWLQTLQLLSWWEFYKSRPTPQHQRSQTNTSKKQSQKFVHEQISSKTLKATYLSKFPISVEKNQRFRIPGRYASHTDCSERSFYL